MVTLVDDREIATRTTQSIAAHPAISVETAIGNYLPVAIEGADARPIHQWIEALPGVRYVDVVFCSTETTSDQLNPASTPHER